MLADVTFFESQSFFESACSEIESLSLPSTVQPLVTGENDSVHVDQERPRPLQVYCRCQQPQ